MIPLLSAEMYKLVHLAEEGKDVFIRHAKRKSTYRVIGYIGVDIDGLWHQYIQYVDQNSMKVYARHAQNFKNFSKI